MTRKLFWTLLLIGLAGLFAYGKITHPGTVVITWLSREATIDIYIFGLLSLLLFMSTLWLWGLTKNIFALPGRLNAWHQDRREQRALAALQTATIALQEGRFNHAEKSAKIAAKQPMAAGLAALLGAASAHARQDFASAQSWLTQLDAHPDFADSKHLQLANIALDQADATTALSHLNQVSNQLRKHSHRYKTLLIQAQANNNNWQQVQQLATERKTTINSEQQSEWMKRTIQGLSQDPTRTVQELSALYKELPDNIRDDDSAINTLIQALIQRQGYGQARLIIQESMRRRWRPELLRHYVQAAQIDAITEQLKMCQAWQSQGHNDETLYTVTGQLCLRASLWGQAKKNFEDALRIQPSAAAYSGLAQALHEVGDHTGAQNAEHQAAQFNQVKAL